MACTASPWPDTPKCKCVRRTRLLADPRPRSSPGRMVAAAEQRIPEVRSCVQPVAPNSEVPAVQAASCRDRHRTENWQSTLGRISVWSDFSILQVGIPPRGGDEVVKNVHHRCRGLDMREVPDAG